MGKKLIMLMSVLTILLSGCGEDKIDPSDDPVLLQAQAAEKVIQASRTGLLIESISRTLSTYEVEFEDGTAIKVTPNINGPEGYVFISSIDIRPEEVNFLFTDGKAVTLGQKYAFSISFDSKDMLPIGGYSHRYVHYAITGAREDILVNVNVSDDDALSAHVFPDEDSGTSGKILIQTLRNIPDFCYVTVTIANGKNVISKMIILEKAGLKVEDNQLKNVSSEGGEIRLEFLSNVECEVEIPAEATDWISELPDTRSLELGSLTVKVSPNDGHDRSIKVKVKGRQDNISIEYYIIQEGLKGYSPDSYIVPPNEIWYVTESGRPVDIYRFNSYAFVESVKSHEYVNGMGVIRFHFPVTTMNGEVFRESDVTQVYLPEGFEGIRGGFSFGFSKIKKISIPRSMVYCYGAPFRGCEEMEGIYGNENFHTADNLCFISTIYDLRSITTFLGRDCTSYKIEEGIEYLSAYSFENLPNLKSVTLPASVRGIDNYAFTGSTELDAIYGPQITDNRFFTRDTKLVALIVRKDFPSYYRVPDHITGIETNGLNGIDGLEEIDMGDQLQYLSVASFCYCKNLRKITLSARLKEISPKNFVVSWNPFTGCENLEEVYLRAPIPPAFYGGDEETNPNLKIYVPMESLEAYRKSSWSIFGDRIQGYKYTDLPEIYTSSDYSQDGKVTVHQRASRGKGVNIVLMGDGYTDRDIASGLYGKDMDFMYESLFTLEPFASFKEMFNIYSVTAVSATDNAGDGVHTAFETEFGPGTQILANHGAVIDYGLKALAENEMDEALVIVSLNSDRYAGTTYMFSPSENKGGDYGSGFTIAYVPKDKTEEAFASILHHEANGHGFAKLGDEYFYGNTITSDEISRVREVQQKYGWFRNIDFTGDPYSVGWSRFIFDSRYVSENIGVFEGGYTYKWGVWRPTETSLMVDNVGEFNAPSRESIYYRINKLSYGEGWSYDYEDFVAYDLSVRNTRSVNGKDKFRSEEALSSPVIVESGWRQVRKK